jgi:hypothetical protein
MPLLPGTKNNLEKTWGAKAYTLNKLSFTFHILIGSMFIYYSLGGYMHLVKTSITLPDDLLRKDMGSKGVHVK